MIRQFCFFLMVSGLLSACNPNDNSSTQGRPDRPNVVLILADDQGWGDLGFTGNPVVETPSLDSLSQFGAIMDRFYVCAVCSPTRSELLTGRFYPRSGVYSTSAGGERIDLDETTLADILQRNGYATGAFGKWHSGMQAPYHPNFRGFDEFYGYCSGHWGSYFDAMLEHNGKIVQSEGFLTDVLTDKTIEFISENKDEPFFAYLPLNTPHSPMQVPDRWWSKFENMPLPEHRYSDREKVLHTRAAYAMTENIDWNVGRVTKVLTDLGLAKNTIVIYLSDNGPNGSRWNGGMEGTKGTVNEGGVRTPFIINWPGHIVAGEVIREISTATDLLPTLLDMVGIEDSTNKPLDGISLASLITGDVESCEERRIVNHWQGKTSVRNQQFRLDQTDQLFDMVNDPGQTMNVAEAHPTIFAALSEEKARYKAEVLSELPAIDERTFPIGHPDAQYTQLPARDGIAHGNIQRSNRWPNCSYYGNWTSTEDAITWEAESLSDGEYEVILYYTCTEENAGCTIRLEAGESVTEAVVTEAFDPPLRGMEHDRFERGESYVKDWQTMSLGTIQLRQGKTRLSLTAPEIPGSGAVDFRMLMLVEFIPSP